MNQVEFQSSMNRLTETFGKHAFSNERLKKIYSEVKELTSPQFEKVIDSFVDNFRSAPLPKDFREVMAKTRENFHERKRDEWKSTAEKFFRSDIRGDDIGLMVGMIKKRMNRELPEKEWEDFMRDLDSLGGQTPEAERKGFCKRCEASGLIFKTNSEGYEFVYRCSCRWGAPYSSYPLAG